MDNSNNVLGLLIVVFLGVLTSQVLSKTNSPDVSALNVMYTSLNSPSKLSTWKSSGGDPCGDSWEGITCSGSSVTEIDLSNLGLSGSMGYQLSSLTSVTHFDLSKNNIKGDIPYQLPPNVQHLDLSHNGFTNNVPYSVSQMTDLEYLNLGNNQLNGQLSDMFQQLPKLKELDLSFNSITGNLPQSFSKLSSLTTLHLQNNKFTGTIDVLTNLPLDDLNIENNEFSGSIPDKIKDINNLETGGNSWSSGSSSSSKNKSDKKGKSGGGGNSIAIGLIIAGVALGVLAVIAIVISVFSRRTSAHESRFLDEERFSRKSFSRELSRELTSEMHKDFKEYKSVEPSASIDIVSLQNLPSVSLKQSFSDNEFANRINSRRSTSVRAVAYALSDLQNATANFAAGRLVGQGSVGRVYRAKYADGKVLAVKKIDSSLFQGKRAEEFSEMVASISKLRHQNIVELVGYCSEQGHNMLIYEYFRNGSLHDFLHLSDDYSKPLTWNTRVRIALGMARGLEYLHEVCSPSVIHKGIKSSNIFLDVELNPRVGDSGLGRFNELTSQSLGVGYNAPECTHPSAYTIKSDVYSFGVVISKAKVEQCLARWATPQLHDLDALASMVDPALRGLYPPKSLSRFADIIALCVQSEPEFRPPMSEVVQALVRLVQRSSMKLREDLGASRRMDDDDYY
ncbi:hypothetical protein FEM48_Zijuj10G0004300 [Ziziphus jujuba var. spinosa]|uniref:Protein kinase domain-containing protein n=1 Tax=Ziziphus jujuba var. spinosa TaxID=714518 RepID=A0A978UK72_ZIZJJ|nr:hypothetical protein FEM48_Zijuj10G0004300 [Ziziphus jujuba var. spinosa]